MFYETNDKQFSKPFINYRENIYKFDASLNIINVYCQVECVLNFSTSHPPPFHNSLYTSYSFCTTLIIKVNAVEISDKVWKIPAVLNNKTHSHRINHPTIFRLSFPITLQLWWFKAPHNFLQLDSFFECLGVEMQLLRAHSKKCSTPPSHVYE